MGDTASKASAGANERKSNISAITARLFGLILKLPVEERRKMLDELEYHERAANRQFSRKNYFMTVQYVVNERLYDGFIKNISPSGLFIEASAAETRGFEKGDPVILTFRHPEFNEHVKITGDVVRIDENGIGVEFHRLLSTVFSL